jgi:hypothetical protein
MMPALPELPLFVIGGGVESVSNCEADYPLCAGQFKNAHYVD